MVTVTDREKQQPQTLAGKSGRVHPLAAGEAHLWQVSLKNLTPARELLSAEELERADRFKRIADQERFLKTRGVLRQLLSNYCDVDASGIRFNYNDHGKPSLDSDTRLKFNVSHSGDWFVAALMLNAEVGVDIEQIVVDKDTAEIAKRFFDKREQEELAQLRPSERQAGFFSIWTRKEALVKGLGLGLWQPSAPPGEIENWNVFNTQAPEGFAAALAVQKPFGAESVRYLQW
jgi:4'-phosphopantetheinyl transferase